MSLTNHSNARSIIQRNPERDPQGVEISRDFFAAPVMATRAWTEVCSLVPDSLPGVPDVQSHDGERHAAEAPDLARPGQVGILVDEHHSPDHVSVPLGPVIPSDNNGVLSYGADGLSQEKILSPDTIAEPRPSIALKMEAASDLGSGDDFSEYACPIASTDYVGIEKLDPRLADRLWRLNNLYYVINEQGVRVRFKMRPAQYHLLKNLHYKNIILKARQLGFTTFICIFLLDYALFNRNKMVGIIAHTQTDATVIFRKVKTAWDNFPEQLKDYLKLNALGDSKQEYEFSNGSIMRISTSLRSGTYQAVLITEFGKVCARFPEKAEEIITGTLPAVPVKGLVFIESTAEGEEGRYYEMCQDAMENKRLQRQLTVKDYKFFFFPWYQNPANQVEGDIMIPPQMEEYLAKVEREQHIVIPTAYKSWYFLEQKTQKAKMKQEHPSTPEEAFLVSGNKLFDGLVIDLQRERYMRKPIEVRGDFLIYARYNKSHYYGLGADVSQGVARDSSTIVIIDFTTGEVVMTYKSSLIDPVSFAHDIKKAALDYGGCIAAPEANTVGMTTCVTLNNIYDNIYTQTREDLTELHVTQKLGWLTTGATKPKMMYEMSEALADNELKVPDEGILLECKKFNKEDSLVVTVNSSTTRHFDLATACAIAWQMRSHVTRGRATEEQVAAVENRRARNTSGNKSYR